MFLTISTTGTPERPATDLGFLLHKHPDKAQTFSTSYGTAHVFYPEASAERCTAALLLEVDPVALVRRGKGKGRGGAPDSALAQYVNDRPYAASSLLAVALSDACSRSALKGRVRGAARAGRAAAAAARSRCPRCPPAAAPSWSRGCFEPLGWTGRGRAGAAGRAVPASGATRGTYGWCWRASCGSPTRCASCTSCCRCSTTPSTTGSRPTRWTSCCAPARAGWPTTPSRS